MTKKQTATSTKTTWAKFIEGPLNNQIVAVLKKTGSGIHCIVKEVVNVGTDQFILCVLVDPKSIKEDKAKVLGAEYIKTDEVSSFLMLAPEEEQKEEKLIAMPNEVSEAEAKQQAEEMKRMK